MKSKLLTGVLTLLPFFLFTLKGYSQSEKAEEIIKQMEAAGKLKRIGNTLEFTVDKPSDTVQVRKKYENVFKKPDGSNYELKFFINPKYIQNNKQLPVNTVAGTPGAPVTGPINTNNTGCCCSNMKTFEYIGIGNPLPLFSEYNWAVPAGVTKIKIEAWSAGGDGWSEIYPGNYGSGDTLWDIKGGGGGGGGYFLSIIAVKPGDGLKIRVPGGGCNYPLIIQFAETGIGYVNIQSGFNAKESAGINRYKGEGGRLMSNSGIFKDNFFSIKGADGQVAYLSDYRDERESVRRVGLRLYDFFNIHGGNGGDAPKSVHGGYESQFIVSKRQDIVAKNGGYPGGGGGGGWYEFNRKQYERKSGRGAPGVIIIYY
jgi:hypothetical protein